MDLGALTPRLPKRLFTRDKRIHLAPDILITDNARMDLSGNAAFSGVPVCITPEAAPD